MDSRNAASLAEMEHSIQSWGGRITTASRIAPPSADVIPTGIAGLDAALGIGGIPAGRITEIYGGAMTGKTALALRIAAQAQRQGNVLYIDADNALSPFLLRANGVTDKNLYLSRPDTLEMAFEICWWAAQVCRLIVIDSLSALPTKVEKRGEAEHSDGGTGKLYAQGVRVLTPCLHKTGCALLVVNQTRQKIGVVIGDPFIPTGGCALGHYKAVSIETRKAEVKRDRITIKATVRKNKCAAPMKEAYFCLDWRE